MAETHPAHAVIAAWHHGDREPATLHALADTLEEHGGGQGGDPRKLATALHRAARRIERNQPIDRYRLNSADNLVAHTIDWLQGSHVREHYEDRDRGIKVSRVPITEWARRGGALNDLAFGGRPDEYIVTTQVPERYRERRAERGTDDRRRSNYYSYNSNRYRFSRGRQQRTFTSEEEAMAHVRAHTNPEDPDQFSMGSLTMKPTGELGRPKKGRGFKKPAGEPRLTVDLEPPMPRRARRGDPRIQFGPKPPQRPRQPAGSIHKSMPLQKALPWTHWDDSTRWWPRQEAVTPVGTYGIFQHPDTGVITLMYNHTPADRDRRDWGMLLNLGEHPTPEAARGFAMEHQRGLRRGPPGGAFPVRELPAKGSEEDYLRLHRHGSLPEAGLSYKSLRLGGHPSRVVHLPSVQVKGRDFGRWSRSGARHPKADYEDWGRKAHPAAGLVRAYFDGDRTALHPLVDSLLESREPEFQRLGSALQRRMANTRPDALARLVSRIGSRVSGTRSGLDEADHRRPKRSEVPASAEQWSWRYRPELLQDDVNVNFQEPRGLPRSIGHVADDYRKALDWEDRPHGEVASVPGGFSFWIKPPDSESGSHSLFLVNHNSGERERVEPERHQVAGPSDPHTLKQVAELELSSRRGRRQRVNPPPEEEE